MSNPANLKLAKGSYQLFFDENLVITKPIGIWGASVTARYIGEFKRTIEKLNNRDWAQILFLDRWVLGTPDIEPLFTELGRWCFDNNLKYTAVVFSDYAVKQYQLDNMMNKNRFPESYQRKNFDSPEKAVDWLAEKGFTLSDKLQEFVLHRNNK